MTHTFSSFYPPFLLACCSIKVCSATRLTSESSWKPPSATKEELVFGLWRYAQNHQVPYQKLVEQENSRQSCPCWCESTLLWQQVHLYYGLGTPPWIGEDALEGFYGTLYYPSSPVCLGWNADVLNVPLIHVVSGCLGHPWTGWVNLHDFWDSKSREPVFPYYLLHVLPCSLISFARAQDSGNAKARAFIHYHQNMVLDLGMRVHPHCHINLHSFPFLWYRFQRSNLLGSVRWYLWQVGPDISSFLQFEELFHLRLYTVVLLELDCPYIHDQCYDGCELSSSQSPTSPASLLLSRVAWPRPWSARSPVEYRHLRACWESSQSWTRFHRLIGYLSLFSQRVVCTALYVLFVLLHIYLLGGFVDIEDQDVNCWSSSLAVAIVHPLQRACLPSRVLRPTARPWQVIFLRACRCRTSSISVSFQASHRSASSQWTCTLSDLAKSATSMAPAYCFLTWHLFSSSLCFYSSFRWLILWRGQYGEQLQDIQRWTGRNFSIIHFACWTPSLVSKSPPLSSLHFLSWKTILVAS